MRTFTGMLLALLCGCSDPEDVKRAAAEPVDVRAMTGTSLKVNTPRPAATEPLAEERIQKLLLAHTQNEPKRIEKFKTYITKRTGEWNLGNNDFCDATIELCGVWPSQFRAAFTLARLGPAVTTMVSRGDGSGWKHHPTMPNNSPTPLSTSEVETTAANGRAEWMLRLVPLLDPKDRIAEYVAADAVGPGLFGLRVWIGQQPPAVLVVDTTTGLLCRIHVESKSAGRELQQVMTLGDFKQIGGVLLPHRVRYSEGADVMTDWKTSVYEIVDTIDPAKFDKP